MSLCYLWSGPPASPLPWAIVHRPAAGVRSSGLTGMRDTPTQRAPGSRTGEIARGVGYQVPVDGGTFEPVMTKATGPLGRALRIAAHPVAAAASTVIPSSLVK